MLYCITATCSAIVLYMKNKTVMTYWIWNKLTYTVHFIQNTEANTLACMVLTTVKCLGASVITASSFWEVRRRISTGKSRMAYRYTHFETGEILVVFFLSLGNWSICQPSAFWDLLPYSLWLKLTLRRNVHLLYTVDTPTYSMASFPSTNAELISLSVFVSLQAVWREGADRIWGISPASLRVHQQSDEQQAQDNHPTAGQVSTQACLVHTLNPRPLRLVCLSWLHKLAIGNTF